MTEIEMKEPAEIKIDIENETRNEKWNCFCFNLDKNCIQYFTQIGLLSSVMFVSLYKLSTTETNRDLYISLLSSSIGYILPAPSLKK